MLKLSLTPLCAGLLLFAVYGCTTQGKPEEGSGLAIERAILDDKDNFYHVDFAAYPKEREQLPIGVFDSGTGGLTILNALVEFDRYNNDAQTESTDGIPDFSKEKFIYLADQANMPYGNYYSQQKSSLLLEHILKDAQFLLSNKYYHDGQSASFQSDKEPVKIIVVACNTATAYGKEHLEEFVQKAGAGVKIIGVIDAGARGALELFQKDESGSIGVLATVGTVASKGYEKTLMKLKEEMGYTGNIMVFNRGGYGLAETVDEEAEFIDRKASAPRANYKGPSWEHPDYTIDKALMDVYNFDFDRNKMLCSGQNGECEILQLNAAENYVRYHLVSLLEGMRKTPGAQPLKAILLGCTHYPYLTEEIHTVLKELYDYQKDGEYVYRALMTDSIRLVDPAQNVAKELYMFMKEKNLFNASGAMEESEFFISVPNLTNRHVVTDSLGRFTYDYKYGRNEGEIQEYVKVVPFSKQNIPSETLARLRKMIPRTYALISRFNHHHSKTTFLLPQYRIERGEVLSSQF
jgi:glutamate racemase